MLKIKITGVVTTGFSITIFYLHRVSYAVHISSSFFCVFFVEIPHPKNRFKAIIDPSDMFNLLLSYLAVTLTNATIILEFSLLYTANQLRDVCTEFITNNLGYLIETRFETEWVEWILVRLACLGEFGGGSWIIILDLGYSPFFGYFLQLFIISSCS